MEYYTAGNGEKKTGKGKESGPGAGAWVALGLGANLERPDEMLLAASRNLARAGVCGVRMSSIYRTAPEACVPGTPDFLNAALVGRWTGGVEELHRACRRIEVRMGRPLRHSSAEARVIDIDILLFGDREIRTPELRIPHPGLFTRLFVLVPLAEIAGEWPVPPSGVRVQELLEREVARVGPDEARRRVRPWTPGRPAGRENRD